MKIGKPIAIKRATMTPLAAAVEALAPGKALPVVCASKAEAKTIRTGYDYHRRNKTGRYAGATIRQAGLTLYFMKEAGR